MQNKFSLKPTLVGRKFRKHKKKEKKHDDDMLVIEDNGESEDIKKTYRTVKKYIKTSEKELGFGTIPS